MTSKKVLLASVFLLSILAITLVTINYRIISLPFGRQYQSQAQDKSPGHFSVVYRGFFTGDTSYKTDYPDYYVCINDLKSSETRFDVNFQLKNQEDRGYYVRMQGSGSPPSGWTLQGAVDLGLIDVDETKTTYYWMTRTRPTSIPEGLLTETVSLSIAAYRDSGYSDLYSQDAATLTFHFIDRASTSWTTLYHDNFDDGTVQGWAAYSTLQTSVVLIPSTLYYRSFGYSARLAAYNQYYGVSVDAGFAKAFTVSTYQQAYLIFSVRSEDPSSFKMYFDNELYFVPDKDPTGNTWYQFAVPLPTGKTTAVEIDALYLNSGGGNMFAYLDDVYVIAK